MQEVSKKYQAKVTTVAATGAGLEFYDFAIYAYFAPQLAVLFFPSSDYYASLMLTFGVFAVGYFSRPLGGVIYGYFGDQLGRKKLLISSILLMAIPTFLIGLLPTYQQIGILAPILLIIMRFLQGIAVGGDIPGAAIFVAEYAPAKRRGFLCSFIFVGNNSGIVLAITAVWLVNALLTEQQVYQWGWRIPFLFGIALAFVGAYLRRQVAESPVFTEVQVHKQTSKKPVSEVFLHHKLAMIINFLLTSVIAVSIGIVVFFMPTYLVNYIGINAQQVWWFSMLIILNKTIFIILSGWLSDRIGKPQVLFIGAVAALVSVYYLFLLLSSDNFTLQIGAVFFMSALVGLFAGPLLSTISELFPAPVRYTGFAIPYNLSFAILGGITPALAILAIRYIGLITAPAFLWMLVVIPAIVICILLSKQTSVIKG